MVIQRFIRDVPDFPKAGIVFKDITPLLADPAGLRATIDGLLAGVEALEFDIVAGIESRGFLFGTVLADRLHKGFVPIRKPGKLPWKTASESYDLEYGQDTLEVHTDAFHAGARVLLVDDLLATGGTMAASISLVRKVGGVPVGAAFVVELAFLNGRERLGDLPLVSLTRF
ncbi:MAG: adenine phosphoribosyltransferase [Planctomycetota bacterium]